MPSDRLIPQAGSLRIGGPAPFATVRGAQYALAGEYDHAAISGYYWLLYHNIQHGGGDTPADASPPARATSY